MFRLPVEAFIGWRYLKAKRTQTFISVISLISLGAVALGVAVLIVVLAVMSGFEEDLKTKILGVNSHIVVVRSEKPMSDYRTLLGRLERVEGVAHAEPFIYSQVMISALGGATGAVLRGIDPELADREHHWSKTMKSGRLEDLKRREGGEREAFPPLLLGVELARQTGTLVGDSIKVVAPMGRVTPLGARAPKLREYLVVGLVESGMYEFDSTLAYVSLEQAQDFLNLGQSVTGIELKVHDVYRADKTAGRVRGELGPAFRVKDWMQMNRNLFSALKLEKVAMFVILTLTVLVAAFNIVASLTMSVMEKMRDISILMAMGATKRMIMKLFIFQGLVVGVIGTLVGLAGGLLLCELLDRYQFIKLPSDVYYVTTLPVRLEIPDVAAITCSAVLISFLATLYPSWQASRVNPVEALRYE